MSSLAWLPVPPNDFPSVGELEVIRARFKKHTLLSIARESRGALNTKRKVLAGAHRHQPVQGARCFLQKDELVAGRHHSRLLCAFAIDAALLVLTSYASLAVEAVAPCSAPLVELLPAHRRAPFCRAAAISFRTSRTTTASACSRSRACSARKMAFFSSRSSCSLGTSAHLKRAR